MLLPWELEIAADEYEHAASGAWRLAVDSWNVVLALLERQTVELVADVLRTLDLLAFERQHGTLLVETHQVESIAVESRVVVLYESLWQTVGIHSLYNKQERSLIRSLFGPALPSLVFCGIACGCKRRTRLCLRSEEERSEVLGFGANVVLRCYLFTALASSVKKLITNCNFLPSFTTFLEQVRIFRCSQSGDHPENTLAKFGYILRWK